MQNLRNFCEILDIQSSTLGTFYSTVFGTLHLLVSHIGRVLERLIRSTKKNCNALISGGFTYRLYRLKPRASRSKGASNKLWYA